MEYRNLTLRFPADHKIWKYPARQRSKQVQLWLEIGMAVEEGLLLFEGRILEKLEEIKAELCRMENRLAEKIEGIGAKQAANETAGVAGENAFQQESPEQPEESKQDRFARLLLKNIRETFQ